MLAKHPDQKRAERSYRTRLDAILLNVYHFALRSAPFSSMNEKS